MTAELLLHPGSHPIVGHRGASGLAPENTLASFDLALEQGAEAFEMDVRLAGDGVAVVCHDRDVLRTTGVPGLVRAFDSAALAALDAGCRFSPDGGATFPHAGRGIGIPTLRQVLERYPTVPLLIELKELEVAAAVRAELQRAGAERRVVVASFLDAAVAPFRTPGFLAAASRRDIAALTLRSLIGVPRLDRACLYAVPDRYRDRVTVPTRRFVAAARRLGRPVHVWTVNDAATANELWDRGCAGMISNFPGRLLEARNRRF